MSFLHRNFCAGLCLLLVVVAGAGCAKKVNTYGGTQPPPPPPVPSAPPPTEVAFYLTKGDQTALFARQPVSLNFGTSANQLPVILVDSAQQYQEMDGFGYTLTGGSAQLINALPAANRAALLRELFSTDSNAIGLSYLRISIGASDLDAGVFSYNDLPTGQTDAGLQQFSIQPDKKDLIPVLQQALAINPSLRILATPWSAPVWMKTNNSTVGGRLKPEYYSVYAAYLVKYIQAMKGEGITISAITPQNEPLHGGNNPSMEMEAAEQADFIKHHLGPAFRAAGLNTKIIIYDHNADRPDYPLAILADADARAFVDGSAFHLYGGDISALSQVRIAHPDKHIY